MDMRRLAALFAVSVFAIGVIACGSDDSEPECRLNSDCPGDMLCIGDKCLMECKTDKDCLPDGECENGHCKTEGSSVKGGNNGFEQYRNGIIASVEVEWDCCEWTSSNESCENLLIDFSSKEDAVSSTLLGAEAEWEKYSGDPHYVECAGLNFEIFACVGGLSCEEYEEHNDGEDEVYWCFHDAVDGGNKSEFIDCANQYSFPCKDAVVEKLSSCEW
jgi:hypothetical protein